MKKTLSICALAVAIPATLYALQKPLTPQMQVKQVNAVLNVKQLAVALNAYAADADETYPFVQNINTLKVITLPYVKDKNLWKCENPKTEIRFNSAVGGVQTSKVPEPAKTALFFESKTWPDSRRAVSFADGNARALMPFEWAEASKSLLLSLPKSANPLPTNLGKSWKD